MQSPSQITGDMLSLISKCNPTLPLQIIKEIHIRGIPLTKGEITNFLRISINNLRKPDGSKYGKNINRVVSATLNSTNWFTRLDDSKYSWNEKEVLQYLKRNAKGENEEPRNYELIGKKRERPIKLNHNINILNMHQYKFENAFNVWDELMKKYSVDKELNKKISNPWLKCQSSKDWIVKLGSADKLIGMLMCFKIFKPILKKDINMSKSKTKSKFIGITENIENLKKEIDYLHNALDLNCGKNNESNNNNNNYPNTSSVNINWDNI